MNSFSPNKKDFPSFKTWKVHIIMNYFKTLNLRNPHTHHFVLRTICNIIMNIPCHVVH